MNVDQSGLLDVIERLSNEIVTDKQRIVQLEKSIELVSLEKYKPVVQWVEGSRSALNIAGATYFLSPDYVRNMALLSLKKQVEDCKNSIRFNTKKIVEYTKKMK